MPPGIGSLPGGEGDGCVGGGLDDGQEGQAVAGHRCGICA